MDLSALQIYALVVLTCREGHFSIRIQDEMKMIYDLV